MPTFGCHAPGQRKKLKEMVQQLISLELAEIYRIDKFRTPHERYLQELRLYIKNQRTDQQILELISKHKSFLKTTWELSLQTVKRLPCFSCQHPCVSFENWRREHLALVEKQEENPDEISTNH